MNPGGRQRTLRALGRAIAAGIITLLGSALPARASLGGDASSIEADRVHMQDTAPARVTARGAYEMHEIQGSGGTVIREYLSPSGTVFAVSWRGQFPPPMQQILGAYFERYSAALAARPRAFGRRPLNLQEEGLVVQTAGRMRAHLGRAVLPGLLPPGLTIDQIQ